MWIIVLRHDHPATWMTMLRRSVSGLSRILFGEFESDTIDHLPQAIDGGIPEESKVGPIERFAVANRAFGGDFNDQGVRKGADEDFKPAVLISRCHAPGGDHHD